MKFSFVDIYPLEYTQNGDSFKSFNQSNIFYAILILDI